MRLSKIETRVRKWTRRYGLNRTREGILDWIREEIASKDFGDLVENLHSTIIYGQTAIGNANIKDLAWEVEAWSGAFESEEDWQQLEERFIRPKLEGDAVPINKKGKQ